MIYTVSTVSDRAPKISVTNSWLKLIPRGHSDFDSQNLRSPSVGPSEHLCQMWRHSLEVFLQLDLTWMGWIDQPPPASRHNKKRLSWSESLFSPLTPAWLDNKRNPSFLLQSPTSSLRCQVSVCVNKHQKYAWTYRQKKEAARQKKKPFKQNSPLFLKRGEWKQKAPKHTRTVGNKQSNQCRQKTSYTDRSSQ